MRHTAVIGLGYGDEGKGAVVDRLCAERDVGMVVRWNGGAQAQHNVVTDDGRHHTFSQFGAGTLQGVPTYLHDDVMVEPLSMMVEAAALERQLGGIDPMREMYVSPVARLTAPHHWLVNRWREDQLGDKRHGSTGRGIGATAEFALTHPDAAPRTGNLHHHDTLRWKFQVLEHWALEQTNGEIAPQLPDVDALLFDYMTWLSRIKWSSLGDARDLAGDKRMVFEGAQGVLLDEHWGWHPHTTWSRVTPHKIRTDVAELGEELDVMGVTRAYTTRHGAGPFVAEDASLRLPESHNQREHFQGGWRVGHLDVPALRYAVAACMGIDSVYVTHIDTAYSEPLLGVCMGYKIDGKAYRPLPLMEWDFKRRAQQTELLTRAKPVVQPRPTKAWGESVSQLLGVPLAGIGTGPNTGSGVFMSVR